jgi:diguanylate cyclase (GGDEF)-like protein
MGGIIGQALARARLHDHLRHLALHDPLTGLASRRLLADRYLQLSARARRSQRPIGLLFVDLDGFKGINDRYGHAAGDQILAAVAHRILSCLRATDTVARVGGDEFVVLCEDTDRRGAQTVARRIRTALAEPLSLTGGEVGGLSASIGIRVHRPRAEVADDLATLLEAADADMYRVKRRRRPAAAGRSEVTGHEDVGLADSAHGRTG